MTMVRRVLRWLKWSLLSVLGVLVLLLALVTSLVSTQPGSRWVLNQAAQRLPLELGSVHGNLIEGLDISYLEFVPEPVAGEAPQRYRVEGLSFRWRSLALLGRTVSIHSLRADAVYLVLPQGDDEAEDVPAEPISDWPNLSLPIRIRLANVDLNNLHIQQGETVTQVQRISGTLTLGAYSLRVTALDVLSEQYQLSANGRMGLRYPYAHSLNLEWAYELPSDEAEPLSLSGQAEVRGDVDDLTVEHQLAAPLELHTVVQLLPYLDQKRNPSLSMIHRWREQSPPAALWPADQPVPVSSGELTVNGWLDAYRLALTTDLRADTLPEVSLELNGEGDLEQFALSAARLHLLDGVVRLSGAMAWLPSISWDLALDGQGINPERLLEGWPGAVNVALATRGELGEDGAVWARVQDIQLNGELRSLPVSAAGTVDYDGSKVQAEQFSLAFGDNRVSVDGHAQLGGEQRPTELALDWSVDAPALAQLDAGLGGRVSAQGRVQGPLDAALIRLKVQGDELSWQDEYHLGRVRLDMDQLNPARFHIQLDAQQISAAEQLIDRVLIEGDGTLTEHEVETRITSAEHGELTWVMAGGYDAEQWRGAVRSLSLEPVAYPSLHLTQAAPLILSAAAVSLDNFCLHPERPAWLNPDSERGAAELAAQVCTQARWSQEDGAQGEGKIEFMPLRLAQQFLPDEIRLRGELHGQYGFAAPVDGDPSAQLRLFVEGAEIRHLFGDDDAETYSMERFEINASLVEQQASATLLSDWGTYGQVEGKLDLALTTGELTGGLTAAFASLSPVEALAPQLQNVEGELNAEFALSGTLEEPQVLGSLTLSEGSARVPEAGLNLQDIGVRASADLQRISLEAEVSSGEGTLSLEAELTGLGEPGWQGRAALGGQNFLALNTPEITALLTPDLTLLVSAEALRLEGSATIPEARANIQSIPETATRTSADVMVIQEMEAEAEAEAPIPIYMDLRLVLGDAVHFDGFGLTSRLSGELALLQTPTRDAFTTGEVGVAEGRYEAYGQDLTIERGRLIFQGPYDNPGLDIRAERTVEEYVVGLEIAGTLQSPRSRVYSTPTLPDSDAMAMLFTGRTLSGGGSSADGAMLVNAIGNLGLERSGFITEEIARTFGLDEVSIQTEDDVTESTLNIGKYLTPRLFVRYMVGLFDQTNKVGFRYDLTRNLHLEGESGMHQSVDMIFKIER